MQSKATTVAAYLNELPADRRAAIEAVRNVILANLDKDYEEGMQYGMIGYYVPHRVYPAGYHCDPKQPLPFANLASQKNYMSIYLMGVYGSSGLAQWFNQAWAASGKKLDMGKCCVRFKKIEDVALDVIAEAIRRQTTAKYVEQYESALKTMGKGKAGAAASKKKTSKKAASKQATSKKTVSKKISKKVAKR